MLNIIVAHCKNRGIGIAGNLPWYLPDDLKKFKKLTSGMGNNAVIMGRKTWESLPNKPLRKRTNIVVSKTLDRDKELGLNIKRSLFDAIDYLEYSEVNEGWIIGGSEIYNLALKDYYIDNIFVTEIDAEFKCDKFFDKIPSNFSLKEKSEWYKLHSFNYRYMHYVNKDKKPDSCGKGYCP